MNTKIAALLAAFLLLPAAAAQADTTGGSQAAGGSGTTTPAGSTQTSGQTTSDDGSSDDGASLGDRTLRKGMTGDDVAELQQALKAQRLKVTPDGEYGGKTVLAVKRYEKRNDLKVDGIVDTAEGKDIAEKAGADGAGEDTGTTTDPAPNGAKATLNDDGTATAPAGAPAEVQQIIAAGNEIATTPYEYGGGHTDDFKDSGYDCSGSVSYALHGANLLKAPLDSGELADWGDAGPGQWVTIYANSGHVYMIVAGLRFDTSGAKGGSRWQTSKRSSSGYEVRHPTGL